MKKVNFSSRLQSRLDKSYLFLAVPAPMPTRSPPPAQIIKEWRALTFSRLRGGIAKRQIEKHDQKTRLVGLAHVAQPSYLALSYFGEAFPLKRHTLLRTRRDPFGIPRLLGLERQLEDKPPYLCVPRFWPTRITRSASARWWAISAPTDVKNQCASP